MADFINTHIQPTDPNATGQASWTAVHCGARSTFADITMYAPLNLNRRFTYNENATDGTGLAIINNLTNNKPAQPAVANINDFTDLIVLGGALANYTQECVIAALPQNGAIPGAIINTAGAGPRNIKYYLSVELELIDRDYGSYEYHDIDIGYSVGNPASGTVADDSINGRLYAGKRLKLTYWDDNIAIPGGQSIRPLIRDRPGTTTPGVVYPAGYSGVRPINIQIVAKVNP